MSKKSFVLSITLVTGEERETKGLPVLKVYKSKKTYSVFDDDQAMASAIIESIKHLEESHCIEVTLADDVIHGDKITRRQRKGGTK